MGKHIEKQHVANAVNETVKDTESDSARLQWVMSILSIMDYSG